MCIDSFRVAGKPDAPAIAKLVNKAYRPHPAESGWTHESGLISGNRTSIGQAVALIFELGSAVLVGLKESRIVACVHVKKDGCETRIGMLAVNPLLQGLGAGKQMLAHAERYANSNFFPEKFVMAVISARNELISFYLRRGYKKTGIAKDYPQSAGAGSPKYSGLKIEVFEKPSNVVDEE